MTTDSFRDYKDLKIYINGMLHIHIEMPNHSGIYSYMTGSGNGRAYFIELHKKQGQMALLEYDKHDLWKEVLSLLDKNL